MDSEEDNGSWVDDDDVADSEYPPMTLWRGKKWTRNLVQVRSTEPLHECTQVKYSLCRYRKNAIATIKCVEIPHRRTHAFCMRLSAGFVFTWLWKCSDGCRCRYGDQDSLAAVKVSMP